MKPSETIRNAALTARLLGFKVVRENVPDIVGQDLHWLLTVRDTRGIRVYRAYRGYTSENSEPTDTACLGHWIVRLYMEKHYGSPGNHPRLLPASKVNIWHSIGQSA